MSANVFLSEGVTMTKLCVVSVTLVAAVAPVLSVSCRSPRPESATVKVDNLFTEWSKRDSPGCGIGISRNGALVYEHAYGMANLELAVPITPASVFPVASISKQFTAMSIVLLAERGQLALEDDVRTYIPEWSDHEHHVTIRQLLTHTSGLRDGFALLGWATPSEGKGDPNDAVMNMLARQRGLNFPPGTEYQYNNGGYNLLGSIVKRVSGQSLRAFADANIFQPLGMTHTHIHDNPAMIVLNRVSGYSRDVNGWQLGSESAGVVGNAGVYSTVGDLLRWEQNFAHVRVGTPSLVAAMQAPTVLTGGGTSPYGFGLAIGDYRGVRTIEHAGSDTGASTNLVRYPDQNLAVAVLCNMDGIDVNGLVRRATDIYLGDVLGPPPSSSGFARPRRVTLSADELASKAGLYRLVPRDLPILIAVRDGTLMMRSYYQDDTDVELTPVNANRFLMGNNAIALEFDPPTADRAQEWRLMYQGRDPGRLQLATFAPSARDLRTYAGEYSSPEVGVTVTIEARESGLVVQSAGRADIVLQAVSQDVFAGDYVGIVKFSRDARGTLTGFTVNRDLARGVRFDRLKRTS
jgi:CubicO group peptidase (beta-lactamase class C family)